MKKYVFLLLLQIVAVTVFSQAKYNDYNVYIDAVQVDPWGGKASVMVYLPTDYKTKSYPVFWFWNGLGEDTGPISVLAKWGPLAFISKAWQPDYIVVAVQGLEWKTQQTIDSVYAQLKRSYNFSKIIASGLSAGGYGVTRLASFFPSSAISKDLVAIIPFSTSEGYGITAVASTVASGIGVWAFGDDPGDVHGVNTHNFYNSLVKNGVPRKYRWTNMKPRGHGGWNDYYNPSWHDMDGKSIYDWSSEFTGGPSDSVPPVEVTRKLIATLKVYDNGDIEKQ